MTVLFKKFKNDRIDYKMIYPALKPDEIKMTITRETFDDLVNFNAVSDVYYRKFAAKAPCFSNGDEEAAKFSGVKNRNMV